MGLKSLSQIRGQDSSDSPSSSGGLKSLQDIRMQQQQQSLMKDYPQMVADEQNYGFSDQPHAQENAQYADLMKQSYDNNPTSFTPQPTERNSIQQGLDYIFKENPVARVLNYPFAKAAEDSIPNAPLIGTRPDGSYGELDGTNARQQYIDQNPVLSTGNATADKVGDFLGGVGAFFTPIGGPGSGAQNVASDIANRLGATKLGMQAENALGNLGAATANKINPYLLGQGIQLSPNLASKTLQAAGKGAVDFGIANPLYNAATTDPTLQSVGQSALEGVLGGAALGGAFGTVGSGLESLASKYAGTKLGDALGRLVGQEPHPMEKPVQDLLALPPGRGDVRYNTALERSNLPANESPIIAQGRVYNPEPLALPEGNYTPQTRLKVASGNDALDYVMNQIKPDVQAAIEMPVRRDLLINYIQDHLQVPREEIHNMPISDLRELGQMVQRDKQNNVYGLAVQAAAKRGYDLPALLEGKTPRITDKVTRNSQERVAGVFPEKAVNIARPESFNISKVNDSLAPRQRFEVSGRPESPKAKTDSLKSLTEIKAETAPTELKPLSLVKEEALNADVQPKPRVRDKVVEFMDKQAEAARKRIEARRNVGFLPAQGNAAVDYAIIGAAHIVKNGVKYADFSEMMIRHYGNQIKPYIPGIYRSSVELAKKNGRMTKKDIRRSYNFDQFNKNNLDETIPDTRGQIVSKTKREPVNLGKAVDNAYIKNVDNLHSMNLLGKAAESAKGEKLSPEDNPHTLALNTRSNDMIAHQIVNEHLVDAKGNVIGPSLKDITKQIPKKQYSEFIDYLVNKHAVDRMNRGEKVFDDSLKMSPEKSAEIARRYEEKYPEFKTIADQYHDFMNKLGQAWLVDTGRIPQEVWDAYRQQSPNYVPNFREMSDLEKRNNFGSGKESFSGQGSGVKEAKGSGRKIIDPIESTIEMISRNVKGAKKNEVMQALSRVLDKDPEALKGFAENVKDPEGYKPLTKAEMLQKLNDEGLEGFLKNEDDALQQATSRPDLTKGNVVSFIKDGAAQHIKVNDIHLLDAISNMEPKAQGVILEGLGKMTKFMKTLTTGINPIFSFTRNIFRDIPDSYKNSTTTNNPITFATDLVHAAISAFGNGDLAQSYKAMGGGHAGHVSASRNLLKQSKNNILAHEGATNTLKYVAQKAWHNFENFNSALETAPRLAEYKRTVKQGGNTYASRVQGIANANDISVNFNRFGTVSKEIDKVIPYYNAAIQGLDKTIRSYKNNPVQATMKSVAAITLPTIALYYINHNDPNYQKLSEYTKDNYFLFPKGDGTFFKIPKPREAGFIFGTMVEQMLRLWSDEDPTAFKNFGEYTKSVWAPPGISGMIDTQNKAIDPLGPLKDSIAGPLVSVLANKDFMDRPIVPKSLQGLSPDMQYNQNTSEIGKALAKLPLNNLSPMQIDYLLKSYGGGVAQFGLPIATEGKTLGSKLTQQITADPTYSNDISTDFYNAKTQYDQQKADAKAQGKVSNTVGTDMYLDKMATVVAQIQKQIKSIQSNPLMSDDTKQEKINALQFQMNNMQQQALKQIKAAK